LKYPRNHLPEVIVIECRQFLANVLYFINYLYGVRLDDVVLYPPDIASVVL